MLNGMSYNMHLPGSVGTPFAKVEVEPLAAHCGVGYVGLLTAGGCDLSTPW